MWKTQLICIHYTLITIAISVFVFLSFFMYIFFTAAKKRKTERLPDMTIAYVCKVRHYLIICIICKAMQTSETYYVLYFSVFFPYYQYLFLHICIIMYPLRVVMLSSFSYFVNPPVWCFRLVTLFYIYSFVMCKFEKFVCYIFVKMQKKKKIKQK